MNSQKKMENHSQNRWSHTKVNSIYLLMIDSENFRLFNTHSIEWRLSERISWIQIKHSSTNLKNNLLVISAVYSTINKLNKFCHNSHREKWKQELPLI